MDEEDEWENDAEVNKQRREHHLMCLMNAPVQKYVEDIVADGILDQALEKGQEYLITKEKTEDKLFIKY